MRDKLQKNRLRRLNRLGRLKDLITMGFITLP